MNVELLIDEVRLLFHRLDRVAGELHRREGITTGQRGILEFLLNRGAASVPQIARARNVTRQHIQLLVNSLLESGLVVGQENPAHRRSRLIELSAGGRRAILRMKKRETRLLEQLDFGIGDSQLSSAVNVLRRLRKSLDKTRPEIGPSKRR